MNGLWRSLVARYLGVVEVVGSNPASPTILSDQLWSDVFLGNTLFETRLLVDGRWLQGGYWLVPKDAFELFFDAHGLMPSKGSSPDDQFSWNHVYSDDAEFIQECLHDWDVALPPAWNHQSTHPGHVFLEDYGRFFHLVVYHLSLARGGVHRPGEPALGTHPLHVLVHSRGVVSWCSGSLGFVEDLRQKILACPSWITDRSGLAFAILSTLFHAWFPLLDELNRLVSQLEHHALNAVERKSLEFRVLTYKHVVMDVRAILVASRDVAHGLARRFSGAETFYYFELYDQVLRLAEMVDGYRQLLDTVMDLHLSSVSNRLNEIVKTLTLVTTMMLPASLVAALYGMNFDHAPGIHWPYGFYFVLGFVALVSAGLLIWFKRQAWL